MHIRAWDNQVKFSWWQEKLFFLNCFLSESFFPVEFRDPLVVPRWEKPLVGTKTLRGPPLGAFLLSQRTSPGGGRTESLDILFWTDGRSWSGFLMGRWLRRILHIAFTAAALVLVSLRTGRPLQRPISFAVFNFSSSANLTRSSPHLSGRAADSSLFRPDSFSHGLTPSHPVGAVKEGSTCADCDCVRRQADRQK